MYLYLNSYLSIWQDIIRYNEHIKDKILGMRPITALDSATIISLLLFINAHHFDFIAVAQRKTPRSNETQSPDEESTSSTSNGQNLNSEVTNTPTTSSDKYLQNLGLQERSDEWDSE